VLAVSFGLAGCGHGGSSQPSATTTSRPAARPTSTITLSTASPRLPLTAPRARQLPTAASTLTGATATQTATAARQAFDTWLGAVAHNDATTMLARSLDAAAAFGSLQLVSDQTIHAEGGTTSRQMVRNDLSATKVTATSVMFSGEADLRETISGQGTHASTLSRLTAVQVVNIRGSWQVQDFLLDGQPMTYYPESATETVRNVHLTIAFVLTSTQGTDALVSLSGSTNSTLYLDQLTLTTSSRQSHSGKAYFTHETTTGIFTFDRATGSPTRLVANFHEKDGTPVNFTINLTGNATG
jgi:hypothetical protein